MRTPWDYMHESMEAKSFSTLNQLARHLRVNRQTVYSWAKGRFVPGENHLLAMASIIDADQRIALIERQCWIAAIERDNRLVTCWLQVLHTITGKTDKLPEPYDYQMVKQYKFRTPETVFNT